MINEKENFQNTWPYKPNYFLGNGFKQHYVDEGENNKKTIICLHGEPTWGYLYRNFIKELSKEFRIIVPDHMGFGKSETPLDKNYTLKTHVENLSNLIKYLKINNIYFVGQEHTDMKKIIVMICLMRMKENMIMFIHLLIINMVKKKLQKLYEIV